MTQEAYPKIEDYNLVSDAVEAYLSFLEYLKIARNANLGNDMLLQILDLFYSVKIDDATITELKRWLDELDMLVEERI